MKLQLKKLLALALSLIMVLGPTQAALAASETSVEAGTYSVPVTLEDTVSAMGIDFGEMLTDTATAVVNTDGSVTFTLTFQTMLVFNLYVGWVGDFYGYYEDGTLTDTGLSVSTVTIQDENGSDQTAVETATFTASSVEDTYEVSYYLASNMMSQARNNKTLTVDWENAVLLSDDAESTDDVESTDDAESADDTESTDDAESTDDTENTDDTSDDSTDSGEASDTLAAGIYSVTVGLKNASNTANDSGAAAVMDTTGYLTVDEDGAVTLTLFFPNDATVMGFAAHATGLDVYEEDGETLMDVVYTQYETDLYTSLMRSDTEEGYAISRADISLTYIAEDGLYSAYIYSDRMSAAVALYVDFDSAETVDEIPAQEETETTVSGSYTGTAMVDGYYYDLTVNFTVEDGVITSVTVTSEEVYAGSMTGPSFTMKRQWKFWRRL